MTRNLLSCRRWFLASHSARSGIWGSVCVLCLTLLAWHLKITQHSQQTSKQRTFLKEREKKWQNNTFASNVYICVLVFIINQHNGWKVLIYEIQIKKIHYASMSFLNGRWTRVLALELLVHFFSKYNANSISFEYINQQSFRHTQLFCEHWNV